MPMTPSGTDRSRGEAEAAATPIGYVPTADSLDLTGLGLPRTMMEELLRVDNEEWLKETDGITEFFKKFGDRLPHGRLRSILVLLGHVAIRVHLPLTLVAAVSLLGHAIGDAQQPGVERLALLDPSEGEVGPNHRFLSGLDRLILRHLMTGKLPSRP